MLKGCLYHIFWTVTAIIDASPRETVFDNGAALGINVFHITDWWIDSRFNLYSDTQKVIKIIAIVRDCIQPLHQTILGDFKLQTVEALMSKYAKLGEPKH